MAKTRTYSFGAGERVGRDSTPFYQNAMFQGLPKPLSDKEAAAVPVAPIGAWADQVYQHSSEGMRHLPDNSIGLAFTSPPYNTGTKAYTYGDNLSLEDYLGLIRRVGSEVYRVLRPGGRYVVNIANSGRSPYLSLVSYFHLLHAELGFLPMGEIIWQKGEGASGSCAWGSWQSARAPRTRDLHEYLLVFTKGCFRRPDAGVSDISREEFMAATLSIWKTPPESAKRIGHPAPFPVALASRVIRLYSYVGDIVLDPFHGSGTTSVAAIENDRHYVGYDISPEYVRLAEKRILAAKEKKAQAADLHQA